MTHAHSSMGTLRVSPDCLGSGSCSVNVDGFTSQSPNSVANRNHGLHEFASAGRVACLYTPSLNSHTLILTRRSIHSQSTERGPVMFFIRDNTLRVSRCGRTFGIGTGTQESHYTATPSTVLIFLNC